MPLVCGNQGVAEVAAVGKDVKGLSVGDWVVPTAPKVGKYTTLRSPSSNQHENDTSWTRISVCRYLG